MPLFTGTPDDDLLLGTIDRDTLQGLDGNDTLSPGLNFDNVDGGDGTDVLVVDYSSLTIDISQFSSSLSTSGNGISYGNIERFNLTGGSGNDNLFGGSFSDTLIGNAGNDTLNGGDGDDSISGGDNDDRITKGGGVDTVDGGAGIDTLVDADFSVATTALNFTIDGTTLADLNLPNGTSIKGFEFFTNITGGVGNDRIRFTSLIPANNNLQGGAGNDILNPGRGFDDVDGGSGIDVLEVDYSGLTTDIRQFSTSFSVSGNSISYRNIERFNLTGGNGNDELFGGNFNDTLIGNAGNDILSGNAGDDSINGGDNDDRITKGDGVDTVDGGAGVDTLVDADFSSTTVNLNLNIDGTTLAVLNLPNGTSIKGFEFFTNITGGVGNDRIRFTSLIPANNNLQGGAGNDTLNPGRGFDDVDGGSGIDVLEVDYSGLTTDIRQFSISFSVSGNSISYRNIERFNLTGGSGNDELFGGSFNDTLIGNAGNDILSGNAGDDSINGGDNDDRITKGDGVDTVDGGAGVDTLVDADFSVATTALNLTIDGTTLAVLNLPNGTRIRGIEFFTNITGGVGNDRIRFTSLIPANNNLQGGAGNDTLNPGRGFDDVDGGSGIDVLEVDYSGLTTDIRQFSTSFSVSGNSIFYRNIERFNLTGGNGNDELFGGSFNDTLIGNAGNDILSGNAGDDSINGGDNDDRITKGDGVDTVDGGAGVDTLVDADFSSTTVNLNFTIDGTTLADFTLPEGTRIRGIEFFTNVTGGVGSDRIRFTSLTPANNNLQGGAGNDTLNPGRGFDDVDGGSGIDVLEVDYSGLVTNISQFSTSFSVSGNSISYRNIERFNLTGGSGNDNLFGGILNDTLIGNVGNDTLIGNDGDDSINGGDSNDSLLGGNGNDTISSGLGIDTVNGGGNRSDLLIVNYSTLTTNITQTINLISADINNQVNYTSIERFNLTGGSGNDSLFGAILDDTLIGNVGNDTLSGDAGNDSINGGEGNDSLIGGDGDDTLSTGLGTDFADGGGSTDLLIVDYSSLTTNISQNVTLISTAGNRVNYSNFEQFNLSGGSGNDTLFGNILDDSLSGGLGNDSLTGGDGNDLLSSGLGNDTVNGGVGIDTLIVNYSSLTTDISQTPTVISTAGNQVNYTGIESFNLTGGSGNDTLLGAVSNDTLVGNSGNDSLSSGGGNDSLVGGIGNDTLNAGLGSDTVNGGTQIDLLIVNYSSLTTNITQTATLISTTGHQVAYTGIERFNLTGGSGNDTLLGAASNDNLSGGNGDDSLTGGAGNDTLTGGGNADRFVFNNSGEGIDTISDFVSTQVDQIVVSRNGFEGGLAVGTLAVAQFISGSGITSATTAAQRFIFNTINGALFFDADGSGATSTALQIATLTGVTTLSNTDILVI